MQTQRTFFDEIKHQYKYGGMTLRLIFINVAIFIGISVIDVFGRLYGEQLATFKLISNLFILKTDFEDFIQTPWTLVTSVFAHMDFFHILLNLIFFYFSGKMFERFFDQKRMLYTYLLAGIFGGVLEILAHAIFPGIGGGAVIGASGAIMGVFMAVAFHSPNNEVALFGIIKVKLIYIAAGFILMDFFALGRGDSTAHFAHLGGAIIGMLSIHNIHSPNNLINRMQGIGDWFLRLFSRKEKSKFKVKKGGKNSNSRIKKDEDYVLEKNIKQEEIDRILDKISKSGYDSLSKKEKDFLFNQSKNG